MTTILYLLADPFNYSFARPTRRGTWRTMVPPWGGAARDVRVRPLIIEWEPGSEVIGDFSWPGFGSDVLVKKSVFEELQLRFKGIECAPVVMQPHSQARVRKRNRNMVKLPYTGPELCDLWVDHWVPADKERSTIEVLCDEKTGEPLTEKMTGEVQKGVIGVEHTETHYDRKRGELITKHIPREPDKGVFLHRKDLGGNDFFHVIEAPAWTCCTAEVKRFIEEQGYTNVAFGEVGEILE